MKLPFSNLQAVRDSAGKGLYFALYVGCELLNVVLLGLAQPVAAVFLTTNWYTYGFEVFKAYREQRRSDPMCTAFPRVASCTYDRYVCNSGGITDCSLKIT